MPNLLNLTAETGANLIGDDTGGASGSGAAQVTFTSSAAGGLAASFNKTAVSAPTVAVVSLDIASGASAPVLELRNQGFISAISIVFAASANWAGMGTFRVKIGDVYGHVPVLPDAVVTAAAR